MGKIITIANQKGGVGKTSVTLGLGAQLESKGFKVLYVDLDRQCSTSNTLKLDTDKKGSKELLANNYGDIRELVQINANNQCGISSSKDLGVANKIKQADSIKKGLDQIKDIFDFILIDTAPNLNEIVINSLIATDYLIIVANADMYSIEGIKDLQGIISEVKSYNDNLIINGILLNKFNERTTINKVLKESLQVIATAFNTKVYNTYIRENIAVKESQCVKRPLTEYAPNSKANIDFKAFADEFLKDIEG